MELTKACNSTTMYAHNAFSDQSLEEFSVRLGLKGYAGTQIHGVSVAISLTVTGVPVAPLVGATVSTVGSFDWRTKGGITAVKDQLSCGGCWAFSCLESIESAYIIQKNITNQAPLSPQQIIDCDAAGRGCVGGDLPLCYNYIQAIGGVETEFEYPYLASGGTCGIKANLLQNPIKGFQYVIPMGTTDEMAMATFVANNSPISILVDASTWAHYTGGIVSAAQCGTTIDHAVQIIGYNILGPTKYWIVRNSWGPAWGEGGFILLEFGTNACVLTYEVTVPII